MEYEFDLDNTISSLDSVPDDLKHFYAKDGDGYKVAGNMAGAAKRINGLTTNLKTERSKKSEANGEAAKFRTASKAFNDLVAGLSELEDKTPDGLKAYLDKLNAAATAGGKKGAEAAQQLEAVKTEMAKAHAIQIGEKDKALTAMEGSLSRYMIGDVANTALAEHKGNPLFLRPHIDRMTKVVKADDGSYSVQVLDDKGQPRYNGEGNPMTVAELVVTLKKDDKFAAAFEGRTQGGGGTNPSKKTTKTEADNNPAGKKDGKDLITRGLRRRQQAGRV